ncbi:hypothetical protein P154DRAFT_520136 [Amniculicola lignicola CBS 123094]|uniref:Eisosome protein 1 n=1 Tax=Amniculicola lignicola CBS 123094 TaxID=1392246 RepID=A0A6A5WRJ6_9PLEO|nr:hypothetical protein P154DRAFT_520136 [Amniculicola lignicola CBS 123094]
MATQTQPTPNGVNTSIERGSTFSESTRTGQSYMHCPDPSAHNHATKTSALQNQASAAALYSTKEANKRSINPLGPDGKLSSASAATSLRQAKPHELPSYPSVGIDTRNSANTAANLAHANAKSPSYPKSEPSAAAGKAALLAHDYKMAPLWQPEASAAGSKAALLAHRDGAKLNLWKPEPSAYGNTAANIAVKKQGLAPVIDYGHTEDGRKGALMAATGAVSSSAAGRRRALSTPAPGPQYPDSQNSARNALSAATFANAPSTKARNQPPVVTDSNRLGSPAMEAARIQHNRSIRREMFTEHPPIRMEVEEKQHKDALRASAISMAKQMYDLQQHHIDNAAKESSQSHARAGALAGSQRHKSQEDIKAQAMQYINIQEAAQKLANERLAKIGMDENAAYRSHYGFEKQGRSKLSIRRGRGRAASDPEGADSSDDEFRARRVRSQMSQFNKSLAEVDAKKRDTDRRNLYAAAERKVQAQMQGMDKKIFDETGKMSPAMIDEWDAKARARASAASEARMENHGRVHVGSGMYMDQSEIDAIAQARIQPTLDEITEKTEKRRAEEEERRLEEDEKRRVTHIERERAAEIKAEERRYKDEEKRTARARSAEEKAAARQEKEAEKEKRAEEKRAKKDDKRKSKEVPRETNTAVIVPTTREADSGDLYRDPTREQRISTSDPEPMSPPSPLTPTSPTAKPSDSKGFKGFMNKLKRRSKHSSTEPGFIGGAVLKSQAQPQPSDTHASTPTSPDLPPIHSPAGPTALRDDGRRYSDISAFSEGSHGLAGERGRSPERVVTKSSDEMEDFEEARDGFDEKLAPPPSLAAEGRSVRRGSPNRDSRFHEVGI